MKNNIFYCCLICIFFACDNKKNEFENNLTNFKSLINEINNYFIDSTEQATLDIARYYTNDFVFYSYPVGYKKGVETTKDKYINNFTKMKKMNISLNIGHSIYLPGMDEGSHKIDGSVRVYYGADIYIEKSNIEFSGYQTINFRDGKIYAIWEWADYGGVNSQLINLTE
tara:strand:- start:188 stop:694 length:507 start_codon:yes stop_codon:yes gene_type:complete